MASKYFVNCQCSRRIPVELFHAGTSVRCPSCGSDVQIPDSVKLKESAGDKYPLLTHIEKLRRTLEECEPPFDGICHDCGVVEGDYEVPIVLHTLVERVIGDDGGVQLTATGVKLVAGAAQEYWQSTSFPLTLCGSCFARFQKAQASHRFKGTLKKVLLAALFVAFLAMAYFNMELVAALAGLSWVVGLIAWIKGVQTSSTLDPYLRPWLEKIRWVPEAIQDAAEYRVVTGQSMRCAADENHRG